MIRLVTAPHSILRAHITGESEEGNRMIIKKKKKNCVWKYSENHIILNFNFDFLKK